MDADGDSRPRLVTGPGGVQVYWKERPLLGADPIQSQRRRTPPEIKEQTLYLLFSPLLGEGLEDFIRAVPRTSAVLLVEYEDALARLRFNPGAPDIIRTAPWAGDHAAVAAAAERFISERAIRNVSPLYVSGGARLHRREFEDATEMTTSLVQQHWQNRGTEIRLGRRWVANIWKNAPRLTMDFAALGHLSGTAAVLVGAGPSLDRNLSLIAEAAEADIPIVAVDTALPALAAAGLTADIAFSMDGQLVNAADFMPWRWDKTILVADVTTHHAIVRRFPPERRFLFTTRFSQLELLSSDVTAGFPVVPPRGSVAPSAVEILGRVIGVREILAIGLDFWYRLPRTHATLATHHRRILGESTRVSGNDGPAAWTMRPWKRGTLRDGSSAVVDGVLEAQARQMERLINTSFGGGEHSREATAFIQPMAQGVPIGGAGVTADEGRRWLAKWHGRSSSDSFRAGGNGAYLSAPSSYPSTMMGELQERRRRSVVAYLERIRVQEEILRHPERPLFLDDGLAFSWYDLPQWPLLNHRREWAEAQRHRLLRAVVDHRRRLERAVSAFTLQDFL